MIKSVLKKIYNTNLLNFIKNRYVKLFLYTLGIIFLSNKFRYFRNYLFIIYRRYLLNISIINDKKDGMWIYWYGYNNIVSSKGEYRDDLKVGTWVYWYHNGYKKDKWVLQKNQVIGPDLSIKDLPLFTLKYNYVLK